MFKVNNKDTWCHLVSFLLTLNMQLPAGYLLYLCTKVKVSSINFNKSTLPLKSEKCQWNYNIRYVICFIIP